MKFILTYVYLIEHKAVLFSAFPTFFLIISVVRHFNTAMAMPTVCWAGISGDGYAIAMRRTVPEERE